MRKNILTIFNYTTLILVLFLLSSCSKDWLDQKPDKNLTIPVSLKDFEAMLDAQVMERSPLTFGDIAADWHTIPVTFFSRITDYKRNAYTWSHERPNVLVSFWNNTYTAILQANVVLEGLNNLSGLPAESIDRYNRIKGNALFQRARLHFELAQLWAPAYESSTANTDLSIPLKLEADINIPTQRSTVKETYDFVIAELNASLPLLPSQPAYKNRASKAAVYGELARVYLSMEDYVAAGKYADSCLNIQNTLLDYNTLSRTANFIGGFNVEVILNAVQGEPSSIFPSNDNISEELYGMYEAGDLRKEILIRRQTNNDIKFRGNYFNETGLLFTGIAVDEMLLVRAEAYARAGDISLAMNDINTLLVSRWDANIPYINKTAGDTEQALQIVLDERNKELLFRGQRWSDLRRLNKDERFKKTITHTVGSESWTLEPGSYQYTFSIPDDVIQFSGISQTPGWE